MKLRMRTVVLGALVGCFPVLAIAGAASADTGSATNCYVGCTTVTPIQTGTPPTSGLAYSGVPISSATSVPTGEPWAGSWPYVALAGGSGSLLVASGLVLRRRRRSATIS